MFCFRMIVAVPLILVFFQYARKAKALKHESMVVKSALTCIGEFFHGDNCDSVGDDCGGMF